MIALEAGIAMMIKDTMTLLVLEEIPMIAEVGNMKIGEDMIANRLIMVKTATGVRITVKTAMGARIIAKTAMGGPTTVKIVTGVPPAQGTMAIKVMGIVTTNAVRSILHMDLLEGIIAASLLETEDTLVVVVGHLEVVDMAVADLVVVQGEDSEEVGVVVEEAEVAEEREAPTSLI